MWTETMSGLDLYCLSKRLQIFQQTPKAYVCFVICALKCIFLTLNILLESENKNFITCDLI